MEKLALFDEIVTIMQTDYAGYLDKKGWDSPQKYRRQIERTPELTDRQFYQLVVEYLSAFKDYHVSLRHPTYDGVSVGFSVRRGSDGLVVVKAAQEDRLVIGDRLETIDGQTISEIEKSKRLYLMDEVPERQNWNAVLKFAKTIEVKSLVSNELTTLVLKDYPKEDYQPCYTYRKIGHEVGLLTLTDFNDEAAIQALLKQHQFTALKKLIIDIRENYGGSDSTYFPLLDLLFSRKGQSSELFPKSEYYYINYTKRNCDDRLKLYGDILQDDPEDHTKEMIAMMKQETEENYGVGMKKLLNDDLAFTINGQANPVKVVILTDNYCASSGESFVKQIKKSEKVSVVGRNTMGCLDYSNLNMVQLGDYTLRYETSKDGAVDHYLPWTSEMLAED